MPTRARAHTSRRRTPARDSGVREPRRGPLPGVSNRPADVFRRRRSGRPAWRERCPRRARRWWWRGSAGLRRSRVLCRRRQGGKRRFDGPGVQRRRALSGSPSLTPESARGAPVWPARRSGRPGAPSQGQGFAAHPGAVALHGPGMEAGPPFQVRPGAASAPPASAGVRSGCSSPAPGADGTTVRASQPPDLARRGQGRTGTARPRSGGTAWFLRGGGHRRGAGSRGQEQGRGRPRPLGPVRASADSDGRLGYVPSAKSADRR